MPEPELTEKEELAIYRQAIANLGKPPTFLQRVEKYLSIFVFYLCVASCVWVCWNYALCPVFPIVPQISMFQSMGLLFLFYIGKKI